MALPTNQLEAISLAVSSGNPLPSGMASALLGAYMEEKNAAENLRLQKSEEETKVRRLMWERDETVRLKTQLEREIEERVNLRTRELNQELNRRTHENGEEVSRWQQRCAIQDSTISDLSKERVNGIALINRMKNLLADKLSEKFWRRLVWRRKAKKVLEDAGFVENEGIRYNPARRSDRADQETSRCARWSS